MVVIDSEDSSAVNIIQHLPEMNEIEIIFNFKEQSFAGFQESNKLVNLTDEDSSTGLNSCWYNQDEGDTISVANADFSIHLG